MNQISLKTLLLVVDNAGIDIEHLLKTPCSIFLLIFSFFSHMIIHITNLKKLDFLFYELFLPVLSPVSSYQ